MSLTVLVLDRHDATEVRLVVIPIYKSQPDMLLVNSVLVTL